MGLSSSDRVPEGISLEQAYYSVRNWCDLTYGRFAGREDNYGKASFELVKMMLATPKPSPLEMRAVLAEVILGYLELLYHESNGCYKMAAYAHEAFVSIDKSYYMDPAELDELRTSPFWPLLFRNRGR
jgi:hypothetical protein